MSESGTELIKFWIVNIARIILTFEWNTQCASLVRLRHSQKKTFFSRVCKFNVDPFTTDVNLLFFDWVN